MTPRQRLDALLLTFDPEIRDAFLAAIKGVVDAVTLQEVIDALERGDAAAAYVALGMSPAAMRPLSFAMEQAFERAGNATGALFPKPGGLFRFDVRNTRAETWLREQSSSLVTRITEDTRVNVMAALETGMREGRNPRSVALDIVGRVRPGSREREGGIVGLSINQDGWVRSARNKLENLDPSYFEMGLRAAGFDRTVQAAIDAGQPLSKETVDKLMTAYKSNALRHRGELIGRTESVAALNRAEWEATKQAVEMGKMSAGAVTREWDSAGDMRVRPSHRVLNGKRVGLDEPFVIPATLGKPQIQAMFPGDASLNAPASFLLGCRCRVRTIIDFFYDLTD